MSQSAPAGPKRLVVCCDGTWNVPDQKGAPTNVIKTVRAVLPADDSGTHQVVYYDAGVGTGNWWDRILGGAFGLGLWQNVKDAYHFLVNNYRDGDHVFLFGFSRGAYTVRSLAGMLGAVGVLHKGDMDQFSGAYDYYRTPPAQRTPELEQRLFGEALKRRRLPDIHFVGVWDTVGALGVPFGWLRFFGQWRYNFHNTDLGRHVRHAYQALAVDEHRKTYAPAVWKRVHHDVPQEVEQAWFAGAHSNVGGGYPDRALSDLAFLWMAGKAAARGLALDRDYIDRKIDRTRMGLLVNSRVGKWKLLSRFLTRELCAIDPSERLHRSVLERRRVKERGKFDPFPYDPANLRVLERTKKLEDLLAELDPVFEAPGGQAAPPSTPEQKRDAAIDAAKM